MKKKTKKHIKRKIQPVVIDIDNMSKKFSKQEQKTLKELIPAIFGRKKTKDEFWALKNINLKIRKGETIGIIGKNGSGKSTLLKLLAGVSKPSKGSITVKGKIAPLIELGAGFHPELSGKENVYLNGSILGLSKNKIDSVFNNIVDFAELWDFIEQPIKHYSSGMYLRLAFAVAIHTEPDILLIDEILAVGDARFQAKCMQHMRSIIAKSKTIVIVSHDLGSLRNLCSKIIFIKDSKVKYIGDPNKAITQYELDVLGLTKEEKDENLIPEEKKDSKSPVVIKNVIFFDEDGNPKNVFTKDNSIIAEVIINSKIKTKNIVLGIAIYHEGGTYLCGTNSLLKKNDFTIKKGNTTLYIELTNMLITGKCFVTIAIHTKEYKGFDWKEKEYSFTIISNDSSQEGILSCSAEFITPKIKLKNKE